MDLPTLLAELDALNFESEPARRLPTDDATPLGAVARHFNRLLDALEGAHDLNENLQIEIQQHAKLEEELRHARDNGDRAAWRRLLAVAMTAMELPHEERREMLEELKVT